MMSHTHWRPTLKKSNLFAYRMGCERQTKRLINCHQIFQIIKRIFPTIDQQSYERLQRFFPDRETFKEYIRQAQTEGHFAPDRELEGVSRSNGRLAEALY